MTLTYELEQERRTQVGLIVLQADEVLEDDMRRLLPSDLSCLVSRVPSGEELTSETLRKMEGHLTQAAALFPRASRFSAVAYGCTSGAAELGSDRVANLIQAGTTTSAVTDPVTALIAATRTLGVSRLGLISPYVAQVSDRLRDTLRAAGLQTPCFASFAEPLEENVARITEASLVQAALNIGQRPDCDAVFLSCTNLRTLNILPRIASEIGKPVLSSNLVLAWHLLGLCGLDQGRLIPETLQR